MKSKNTYAFSLQSFCALLFAALSCSPLAAGKTVYAERFPEAGVDSSIWGKASVGAPSAPTWRIEGISNPDNLSLIVSHFDSEAGVYCLLPVMTYSGDRFIFARNGKQDIFFLDQQGKRKTDCSGTDVLAFPVAVRLGLGDAGQVLRSGRPEFRIGVTLPDATRDIAVSDLGWSLETRSASGEWEEKAALAGADSNSSSTGWVKSSGGGDTVQLVLGVGSKAFSAGSAALPSVLSKPETPSDLTRFVLPDGYEVQAAGGETTPPAGVNKIDLVTDEKPANIYLQVVQPLSLPDRGRFCIRPVYALRSDAPLSVKPFSPERSASNSSVLWSTAEKAMVVTDVDSSICKSGSDYLFEIALPEGLPASDAYRFRMSTRGGSGPFFSLETDALIEVVNIDSGRVVAKYDPNAGEGKLSQNESADQSQLSILLASTVPAGASQSARSVSSAASSSRSFDTDQIVIRPMIRFDRYMKSLKSCIAHLEGEDGRRSQDFTVAGSMQRLARASWGGIDPYEPIEVVFESQVGGGRPCPVQGLRSEPTTISTLIKNAGANKSELYLQSEDAIFVGYLQLNADAYRRSLGRWRQFIEQINAIYSFGVASGQWIDGVVYGAALDRKPAKRIEPSSNFSSSLGGPNALLGAAELWQDSADTVKRATFDEQMQALKAEFGGAKLALYYFDDLPLAVDCESYQDAIAESELLVESAVIVAAVDGNPDLDGKRLADGQVKSCQQDNLRVYAFNWRERMLNLDWDKVLDAINEDVSK